MKKTFYFFLIFLFFSVFYYSQNSKVNSAWRALNDYEETLKEGKPDFSFLQRAKEDIDLAIKNEKTKYLGNAHEYKLRIYFFLYQKLLEEERLKLELTVKDKYERNQLAYGNTELTMFEEATSELYKIREVDPKFLLAVQEGVFNGLSNLDENQLKFALAAKQMKLEAANIASGKYKVKKYEDAANYYYKIAFINTILSTSKDTVNFYNACISASKSKNPNLILEYNQKMIDAKIATSYNYESIFNAHIFNNDTNLALEALKKGRILYPDNLSLLTQETNIFYAQGKFISLLDNLKIAIKKDPENPLYYLFMGNVYDNLANPKNNITHKDLEKPANFDTLFKFAETSYLKVINLKPNKNDYFYTALYNLGAMYNNHGGFIENMKLDKNTDFAKYQKENGRKSQEYYKKAIPFLEQALMIKSDDRPTINALRLLYAKTGNQSKEKEFDDKIKSIK